MMWQIALQIVRQGASDEPAVADQIESPPDGPAVVEVQLVGTDETQAEAVDKLDQSVVASKNQTAVDSVGGNSHEHSPETSGEGVRIQTDIPDDSAVAEVRVADADEPVDSKVCNKI